MLISVGLGLGGIRNAHLRAPAAPTSSSYVWDQVSPEDPGFPTPNQLVLSNSGKTVTAPQTASFVRLVFGSATFTGDKCFQFTVDANESGELFFAGVSDATAPDRSFEPVLGQNEAHFAACFFRDSDDTDAIFCGGGPQGVGSAGSEPGAVYLVRFDADAKLLSVYRLVSGAWSLIVSGTCSAFTNPARFFMGFKQPMAITAEFVAPAAPLPSGTAMVGA